MPVIHKISRMGCRQEYNTSAAMALPRFNEAVDYFLFHMRTHNIFKVHRSMVKRYESDLTSSVQTFCINHRITERRICGRVFLSQDHARKLRAVRKQYQPQKVRMKFHVK